MPADIRELIEIEGLRDELSRKADGESARRTFDELLSRTDASASAPEDRLRAAIERELSANPDQYRATLDVCDGNERTAAGLIVDHMVQLLRHGRAWPMVKSMAHFDGFCAVVMRGHEAQEACIEDLKRRGAELRAAGALVIDLKE